MKDLPQYLWDEERGIATCILKIDNKEFKGMAFCHPEDKDMQSRLTGIQIAEFRALIEAYRFRRDYELKPALRALEQYYYSMNRSKDFDPRSYEAKRLYNHISMYREELEAIKEQITALQLNLRTYLTAKDGVYQALRRQRNKEASDN